MNSSDNSDLEILSCSSSSEDDYMGNIIEPVINGNIQRILIRIKILPSDWILINEFESLNEAKLILKNENIWDISTTNKLIDGSKIYYYCKQRKSQNCVSSLCIEGYNYIENVKIWSAKLPHSCCINNVLTSKHKEIITEVFKTLYISRPIRINSILKQKGCTELKHTIISNFIQRLKRNIFHSIKTYEELQFGVII